MLEKLQHYSAKQQNVEGLQSAPSAIQWLVSVLDRSLWRIPGSSLCLLPADEQALAGTLLVPSGSCLNLWSLDMKEKTKTYPRKKRLASFTFTSPETIQRKRTLAASPTHPPVRFC